MDRPETLPSMFRREATLLLVAFFCPAVLCFLRAGPSTVSSSNPSAEDGDVKIAQKTYRMEHEKKKKSKSLTTDLQKQFTPQKVLLYLKLITPASRIKTGDEIFISR
jgi:hypothetical protein